MNLDSFKSDQAEIEFFKLNEEAQELRIIFKVLFRQIRENYAEIDLDELSNKAYKNYLNFYNKI